MSPTKKEEYKYVIYVYVDDGTPEIFFISMRKGLELAEIPYLIDNLQGEKMVLFLTEDIDEASTFSFELKEEMKEILNMIRSEVKEGRINFSKVDVHGQNQGVKIDNTYAVRVAKITDGVSGRRVINKNELLA